MWPMQVDDADNRLLLALNSPPAAEVNLPDGQAILRLRLIGQMEAWSAAGDNVLPHGRKTRALLAVVGLAAPRPVLRGRLAELLWSRRPEEQARASLRQEIHRLLEALAPAGDGILQATRDHISLKPRAVWVDADEVMRATTKHPESLSLLDGDLLEGLDGIDPPFDAWLAAERERLRDHARTVAEALLPEQVEPEASILAAQRLLQIDRAHEGAWRMLMRTYAARGEKGMAIEAYDRCRTVLADLMDAAPSQETQKLLTEIRGPSSSRMSPRPSRVTVPDAEHPPGLPAAQPDGSTTSATDEGVVNTEGRTEVRAARAGAHIGVRPLQRIGIGDDAGHFAGLAEEITIALTRFRGLFVVSSTALAGAAPGVSDERAIRGLDFLVDGTVQKVRDRVRVTIRLLDLRAGDQVAWSRRFDRQAGDLLALQEEIAAEVVAQIDAEILLIEARCSAVRPATDATAYDFMLQAVPLIGRMDRVPFMKAGDYLAKAIKLEPGLAAAYAWYAYWHVFLVGQGWTDDAQASTAKAGDLAERAIVLDPLEARALTIAGHVRACLQRRPREAVGLHERALSLNPNLAMGWALSAATHAYLGDPDEAERRAIRYKRLSPLDPQAFSFDGFFILIHLLKRDYETAIATGRAVSEMNPTYTANFKPYLAALGHRGRTQEAVAVRRRLLAIEPEFSVARFLESTPIECQGDRDNYAEGLRRAGVQECTPTARTPPAMAPATASSPSLVPAGNVG